MYPHNNTSSLSLHRELSSSEYSCGQVLNSLHAAFKWVLQHSRQHCLHVLLWRKREEFCITVIHTIAPIVTGYDSTVKIYTENS